MFVRRSHKLHAVHGEPVSPDAVVVRVRSAGRDSSVGIIGNTTESLASRHDSSSPAEDCRASPNDMPPRGVSSGQPLPVAADFRKCAGATMPNGIAFQIVVSARNHHTIPLHEEGEFVRRKRHDKPNHHSSQTTSIQLREGNIRANTVHSAPCVDHSLIDKAAEWSALMAVVLSE